MVSAILEYHQGHEEYLHFLLLSLPSNLWSFLCLTKLKLCLHQVLPIPLSSQPLPMRAPNESGHCGASCKWDLTLCSSLSDFVCHVTTSQSMEAVVRLSEFAFSLVSVCMYHTAYLFTRQLELLVPLCGDSVCANISCRFCFGVFSHI